MIILSGVLKFRGSFSLHGVISGAFVQVYYFQLVECRCVLSIGLESEQIGARGIFRGFRTPLAAVCINGSTIGPSWPTGREGPGVVPAALDGSRSMTRTENSRPLDRDLHVSN